VILILALQLVIPLRYYLGGRGDDERFAWRMFSSRRLRSCNVEILERTETRPLHSADVAGDLQAGWISLLRRSRPQVVESYLLERCAKDMAPVEVRFIHTCTDVSGDRVPATGVAIRCESQTLRALEELP
jgi:hypothetical protein